MSGRSNASQALPPRKNSSIQRVSAPSARVQPLLPGGERREGGDGGVEGLGVRQQELQALGDLGEGEVAGSVVGYDVDEHLRRGCARGSYAGAVPRRLLGWLPPPSARPPGRGSSGWRRGWRTRVSRASGAS